MKHAPTPEALHLFLLPGVLFLSHDIHTAYSLSSFGSLSKVTSSVTALYRLPPQLREPEQ